MISRALFQKVPKDSSNTPTYLGRENLRKDQKIELWPFTTYNLGGAVACLSVPQPPLSGTIYKFSGTIFKFSGTIFKFSGTIFKFSGTIFKFSGISGAMYKISTCMLYDFWWFHESCHLSATLLRRKLGNINFSSRVLAKLAGQSFFPPCVAPSLLLKIALRLHIYKWLMWQILGSKVFNL